MTNKEAIYIINNRLNTYYCTDEDLQALDLAIKALEERPQGEFAKMLNERITESVCKWCRMNKHCELCEISRVFMIIALTDEEMRGKKSEP